MERIEAEILETVRIVRIPGGVPKIAGHRIKVHHISDLYEHYGRSVDEILEQMSTLTRAEVHAALSYYYDHKDEIDAIIREENEYESDSPNVFHIIYEQATDPDYKLVLTPQEIAQEYGVTASAVYQAVRRNSIPHRRSGSTILITRWDAEKRWRNPSKRGRPKKR